MPMTFSSVKPMMTKTYHVYLDDRCLFKNLDEEEFKIVWGRLYHSYWDGLTYAEMAEEDRTDALAEHSY